MITRLCVLAVALVLGTSGAFASVFAERKALCVECHGSNGVSTTPGTPSLGGLPEFYALLQLVAFREGNRKIPVMNDITKGMSDEDLRAAAAFVAAQPRPPAPDQADNPQRMARGRTLAAEHRCAFCHGADLAGGDQMPPLSRQREDYLLKSLRAYKSDQRIGLRAAMAEVLYPLKDADLVDLAYFLAHSR